MSVQQERETEEDEGGASDTAPMLPRRRSADYHSSVVACWSWPILATQGLRTLLLSGQALVGFLVHLLLPGTVFLLVLLPAAAVVYLGFLCHSRDALGSSSPDAPSRLPHAGAPRPTAQLRCLQVHPAPGPRCRALLSDRGSAALIVLGFLSLPPLLVLAAAARSLLIRQLRPVLPGPARSPEPHRPPRSREDRVPEDEEKQFCARV
ncbi:transmembrane protein 88B isoform X1 [Meriones unguiculatus]|uniref:transmembrane protein 88B isoform X1 n=1 Tax=Meriones unguiculatus TaxID=10047 RepID=UPI00293E8040|nr:transmembrane protein 88B isoform X1 [Meriones unguiculatus]